MSRTNNMTNGKTFPIIFLYFVPILFSTLFQQLYNFVDAIIVGKGINDMALAAVGVSGGICFFIFGFIMGLTNGVSVLISQAYGSGDYKQLRKTIAMGIIFTNTIGFIIMIISILSIRCVLIFLNTDTIILDDAVTYIVIILASIPFMVAYNYMSAILNALGDSKTPLFSVMIASLINIILDLLFIITFHLGVEGAAIATVIAQVCATIFCYYKLKTIPFIALNKKDWTFDFFIIKNQIRVGIPLSFMNSVTAIGGISLQYYVNKLGVNYTAAYSACLKLTSFMMHPCSAVGVTMTTFAGQNLGAKKINRIEKGIKSGFLLSIGLAIISAILLLCFPEFLATMMLSDSINIELSIGYLRICGVMMWSVSLLFLARGTCIGMGFTFIPMLSGFAELFSRLLIVILFVSKLGFTAIALAEITAWTSALLLNYIYMHVKLNYLKHNVLLESVK